MQLYTCNNLSDDDLRADYIHDLLDTFDKKRLVELVTVTRGDDILVRTHADLLALRCHVAPYLLLEALMQLGDLRAIATKAFRAAHGHSVQRACNECDPEQVKQDEEFRRRQAKPKPSKKLN